MKKLFLILFAIGAVSVNALSSPVSPSQAKETAARFFGASSSSPRMIVGGRSVLSTTYVSDPAYYIFNNDGGGFVIVAGDDCLEPILGYSLKGAIDESSMPENMLFWLDGIRRSVQFLRRHNVPALPGRDKRMSAPATRAGGAEGVLLTLPEWSQENPYNWYCPTIAPYESEKSLTGCVATAISMVMRYHQWPPCGNGTLPDYVMDFYPDPSSYKTINIPMPGHALGHEYQWSIMPMNDFYSELPVTPSAGKKQVAWLMYDCGIMMEASYSAEGTGAYSYLIPTRLAKYMYYKSSAKYVTKSSYSTEEWVELLKDQIDKGLPVIYGADCNEGGHQFVVHGYDADGNLYVNWGWGGDCNGYFDIDYFYPYKDVDLKEYGYTDQEIAEIESDNLFDSNHDAIIDLEPDTSATPVPVEMDEPVPIVTESDTPTSIYLKAGRHKGHDYYGLSVSSGTLARGAEFKMNAGLIYNPTSSRYNGYFRFVQTNYKGETVGPISISDQSAYIKANDYYYLYDIDCVASYDWVLGDKIQFYSSKSRAGGNYTLVEWVNDGETIGEIPLIPMYFIHPDKERTLINSNEVYESVEWFSDASGDKATIRYPDGSVETVFKPAAE